MSRKLTTIFLVLVTVVTGIVFMARYNKKHFILYGDSMGYYVYLPATFIYGNLQDMDNLPQDVGLNKSVYDYTHSMKESGKTFGQKHWVNQYTYGVALMEAPFFLVAHMYEKIAGLPANGYTKTYTNMQFAGGLFYSLLGLLLVYKILRRYFDHFPSLLSALLLLLATNMFWFTFRQSGMSHIPLFLLYSVLIYLTIRAHENSKRWMFILMGLVAGIITVIRPTDIICLLVPFLFGVYDRASFKSKMQFLKHNKANVLLAGLVFIVPIVPQLLYWKLTSGKYLYYSYGSQSFNWSDPKIIEGLFHFNNGWLPYAPVMIFALLGLLFYRKLKPWFWVIIAILPVYIYIIYSWYCYNYINGLGSRPMIHLYPLLAIPLAAFITAIAKRGIVIKTLFATVCVFFSGVIFSLSMLMAQFKFLSENANAPFYLGMLFKNKLEYENLVEFDLAEFQPNEEKLTSLGILAAKDFNDSLSEHYVPDPEEDTGFVYQVYTNEEYFPDGIKMNYTKGMFKDAKWIKCSGRFMYTDYADHNPRIFVFNVLNTDNEFIKWVGCKIDNKIGISDSSCEHANDSLSYIHYEYWKWGEVYFYTKVPDDIKEGDKISLDIWNIAGKRLFLDDFKIELYK